ncbi:hypothetical protein NKL07_32765 [Mesorhizobium sp. C280B]|uniref:hypothetical protein n=1 Tax=unclassified Mesorhizobium TaxID=325217 RepID=UPI001FD93657|nr:hypothetical protein [Mesorhizobium sp. LSJC280B00]
MLILTIGTAVMLVMLALRAVQRTRTLSDFDLELNSAAELDGKTAGVETSTAYGKYLESKFGDRVEVRECPTVTEAFADLKSQISTMSLMMPIPATSQSSVMMKLAPCA